MKQPPNRPELSGIVRNCRHFRQTAPINCKHYHIIEHLCPFSSNHQYISTIFIIKFSRCQIWAWIILRTTRVEPGTDGFRSPIATSVLCQLPDAHFFIYYLYPDPNSARLQVNQLHGYFDGCTHFETTPR